MKKHVHTTYTLAKMQRYILEQYDSEANEPWVYHPQFSYDLKIRNLSIPLFFKAVNSVVNRHPVLKTVFIKDEHNEWVQTINPELNFRIHYSDIHHPDENIQQNRIAQQLLEDRNKPFNSKDPNELLIRMYIFKRGEDRIHIIMSIHHAIWDGWSHAILFREIFNHYGQLKNRPTLALSDANYDYPDFLDIEAQIIKDIEAKNFWKNHLKDHEPYWPEHHKRIENYNAYDHIRILLPDALIEKINYVQRKNGVTLKSIFLAFYYQMIAAETTQSSLTIGVVSNGRSVRMPNPLTTLGLLWNLAPVCVKTVQNPIEHIKNVNYTLSEIGPYAGYPLPEIQAIKKTNSLFHATFNYINFESANVLAPDSEIEFLDIGGLDKFHFPLHLLVSKHPFNKTVTLVMNYDSRCYSENEISVKLKHYINALETVCLALT